MESKAKNSEKSSGLLEAWTPEKRYERPLSEGGVPFSIESDYMPAGDQPRAISELIAGLKVVNMIKFCWALLAQVKLLQLHRSSRSFKGLQ